MKGTMESGPRGKRDSGRLPPFCSWQLPFRDSKEGEFDNHRTSPLDSPSLVWLIAKPSGRATASKDFKIHLSSLLVPLLLPYPLPWPCLWHPVPQDFSWTNLVSCSSASYSHRATPRPSFVLNRPPPRVFHSIREDPNLLVSDTYRFIYLPSLTTALNFNYDKYWVRFASHICIFKLNIGFKIGLWDIKLYIFQGHKLLYEHPSNYCHDFQ